jgi:CHASE3 domain sensor protein
MRTMGLGSLAELRDRIRRVVESPAAPMPDTILELAAAYSEAAERVNTRLSRAKEWLRLGLRTEALHSIEQHPDALEAASHLDLFEQFAAWHYLCVQHDVERFIAPDLDAAAELSAAYEMERTLEPRLRQHRLLALVRGPLRDRLEVLRRLAATDEGNQNWESQIVLMERARLAEIKAEAVLALQDRDDAAIQALAHELNPANWSSDQARALRDKLIKRGRNLSAELGGEALDALLPRLHESHAAQDETSSRSLMAEWDELCAQSGAIPSPEQQDESDAVRMWLARLEGDREAQAEFDRGLASLTQALDDEAPLEEVERLYGRLTTTERPIPESLERRVGFRVTQVRTSRRRTHQLAALAIVLLLVGSGVSVWWIVQSISTGRQLQGWTQRLEEALGAEERPRADRIQMANRLLNDVDQLPRIARTPSIATLRLRVKDLEQEERDRSNALAALLDKVSTTAEVDPEGVRLLAEALNLAASGAERAFIQEETTRRQDAIDAPFASRVAGVRVRLDNLPSDSMRQERLAALESIHAELESLSREGHAVRKWRQDDLAMSQERVRGMIAEERGRNQRATRMAADLQQIPERARNVTELVGYLRQYVNTYPESTSGAHRINTALARASDWESLESWSGAVSKWRSDGRVSLRVDESGDASRRLQVVKQLLDRHPTSPLRQPMEEYLAYLGKATELEEELISGAQVLMRFVHAPWMRDMRAFRDRAGAFHYTLGGAITADSIGIRLSEYVSSWADLQPEAARGRSGTIMFADLSAAGKDTTNLLVRAPHAETAEQISRMLDERPPWDVIYLRAAALVQANREIDPLLRAWLIGQILQAYEKKFNWGQIESRDAARNIATFLNNVSSTVPGAGPFQELPWMSRGDANAARGREFAVRWLEEMPDLTALCHDIEQRWRTRTERLGPLRMTGLIWPDAQGTADVRLWELAPGAEVVVVVSEQGRPSRVVRAGTMTAGGLARDASVKFADFPWGTPLFVRLQ